MRGELIPDLVTGITQAAYSDLRLQVAREHAMQDYRGIQLPPYADIILIDDGLRVSHDWLATRRGARDPRKRKGSA
ncbi:hypothetical protein GCM10010994_56380 [Chelatococcus reniformis]|uniref:Uncharacterized protein n=1 Tax=Chelatococcus reniformis TaxID=1494448 RepID=A0A916XNZ9_9HYPH|nr:hypothetical protein GCM10010994_56380 [Chelatococcus reniformis]